MRECSDPTIADLLPSFARGAVSEDRAYEVRQHLALCATCAEDLVVLQGAGRVFAALTPAVDVTGIAGAIRSEAGESTSQRNGPTGRVVPLQRRRVLFHPVLAAAASLLVVGTLSLGVMRSAFVDGATTPSTALVGGAALADLSAEELSTLLKDLEEMEATVVAEPITVQPFLSWTLEEL